MFAELSPTSPTQARPGSRTTRRPARRTNTAVGRPETARAEVRFGRTSAPGWSSADATDADQSPTYRSRRPDLSGVSSFGVFALCEERIAADGTGPSRSTVALVIDELDVEIDDDELTAWAFAADPDQVVASDAVPVATANRSTYALLPEWYMPAPAASGAGRTRRVALGVLVLALVLINGAGLCVTYGFPEIAW